MRLVLALAASLIAAPAAHGLIVVREGRQVAATGGSSGSPSCAPRAALARGTKLGLPHAAASLALAATYDAEEPPRPMLWRLFALPGPLMPRLFEAGRYTYGYATVIPPVGGILPGSVPLPEPTPPPEATAETPETVAALNPCAWTGPTARR